MKKHKVYVAYGSKISIAYMCGFADMVMEWIGSNDERLGKYSVASFDTAEEATAYIKGVEAAATCDWVVLNDDGRVGSLMRKYINLQEQEKHA